jgi:hypothetical protein
MDQKIVLVAKYSRKDLARGLVSKLNRATASDQHAEHIRRAFQQVVD